MEGTEDADVEREDDFGFAIFHSRVNCGRNKADLVFCFPHRIPNTTHIIFSGTIGNRGGIPILGYD
jgi:hypothetical protein